MSDHPTAFGDVPTNSETLDWDDRASLHTVEDGSGIFSDASATARGTFAEMARQLLAMPAQKRGGYLIKKAGDRSYSAEEIADLDAEGAIPSA